MKKIKKFLSVLLSSLALAGGKFTGNNKVFAGGENKIVRKTDSHGSRYYLFVSTENIPKLVDLFQARLDLEKKKLQPFYTTVGYKAGVGAAGAALLPAVCFGASKIKNKGLGIGVGALGSTAVIFGALFAILSPEEKWEREKSMNPYKEREALPKLEFEIESCLEYTNYDDVQRDDYNGKTSTGFFGDGDNTLKYNGEEHPLKYYSDDLEEAVAKLETISPDPRHRAKHGKVVLSTLKDDCWDISYSDKNEGIVLCFYPRNKGGFSLSIYAQKAANKPNEFSPEGYAYLRSLGKDEFKPAYKNEKIEIKAKILSEDNINSDLVDKILSNKIEEI